MLECAAAFAESVDPVLAAVDPPLIVACRYDGCVPERSWDTGPRHQQSASLLGHVAAGPLWGLISASPTTTLVPPRPRQRRYDNMVSTTCGELARTAKCRDGSAGRQVAAQAVGRTRRGCPSRPGDATCTRRCVTRTSVGPVIVVDDVRLGATLAECDRALTEGWLRSGRACGHRGLDHRPDALRTDNELA